LGFGTNHGFTAKSPTLARSAYANCRCPITTSHDYPLQNSCDRLFINASSEPTSKQGQYLAFIYYYTKIMRQPPAETDMQRYFRVSPPSVHNMIVTLDGRGFIARERGRSRTIRLLIGRERIPDLE